MSLSSILDTINALSEAGKPFCVATVVRTADVTSAKAGAKAAITADGEIHGHLGGACVQSALKAAAREVLESREPKLIRVKPSEKVVNLTDADGVEVFKSGCPSGGTVDLLIEAFLPTPRLIVLGAGVVAEAVAQHGALMDFQVVVSAENPARSEKIAVLDGAVFDRAALTPNDIVVVAAQGKGDLRLLEEAAVSNAGFVSLVASRKKADYLRGKLSEKGVSDAALDRIKAPAGKDIGAVGPHEIAISILAEIIELRRKSAGARRRAGSGGEPLAAGPTTQPAGGPVEDAEARMRMIPICC